MNWNDTFENFLINCSKVYSDQDFYSIHIFDKNIGIDYIYQVNDHANKFKIYYKPTGECVTSFDAKIGKTQPELDEKIKTHIYKIATDSTLTF